MNRVSTETTVVRQVIVRYFAAAADVAGCSQELITLPHGSVIDDLRRELLSRHGPRMAAMLTVAAFLVDDELTRDGTAAVSGEVDIMPPFAGG
ncbi:MoaD/ThiS family protein [Gordonia sp. C13]|uniref:MoaD/ThiS family protein n=1 Tax=Gordonia sp. C13 TaxID=2935078 RepID=UPI00200AC00D|nr:MoaD/ThiS family protein [Gordonia sp. C13]MCK8615312.1 MoaD/ThiS family protein [Gordonia sp. C13]